MTPEEKMLKFTCELNEKFKNEPDSQRKLIISAKYSGALEIFCLIHCPEDILMDDYSKIFSSHAMDIMCWLLETASSE